MIKISLEELHKMEIIGIGTFASVYKYDEDIAFKIYHSLVKTEFGQRFINPNLQYPKKKVALFKEKESVILYTDFIKKSIIVDNKFKGFSLSYYNSDTLQEQVHKEASKKIEIAKQILRNGNELIDNHIYPLDCRLENIMLHNGLVKYIDLDDCRTKITKRYNDIYYNLSYLAIGNTIQSLFSEFIPKDIGGAKYFLSRKQPHLIDRKKDISEYISEKETKHSFLVITDQNELQLIRGWLNQNPSDILMNYDSQNYDKKALARIAKEYIKKGVQLYDFIDMNYLPNYLESQNASTLHELKGNQFIKHK